MSIRNRVGLALLLLSVWWLVAAPHSEFTSLLALVSIAEQAAGTILLVWPNKGE